MAKQAKKFIVKLRVSENEKNIFTDVAKTRGQTISEMVRELVTNERREQKRTGADQAIYKAYFPKRRAGKGR